MSSGNSTALTLATQALSIEKIIRKESSFKQLSEELDTATRSVRHLKELPERTKKEKADKMRFIQQAEEKVALLTSQLLALDCKTLSELRILDEESMVEDLSLLIIDLVEYFDVASNMTPERTGSLAALIAAEMGGLLIEDIALCFRNAKVALYGPVYNRLDGAVILGWLQAYRKEKLSRLDSVQKVAAAGYKDDPYSRSKGDRGRLKEESEKLYAAKFKLGLLPEPKKRSKKDI